jgi:hypothetical protein
MRRVLPVSRVTVGLWLWRHRNEILGWAEFTGKASKRLFAGDVDDVVAEARLRMALTADSRTRDVRGLNVDFRAGVATMSGIVDPSVHDAALEVATRQRSVRRVRDEIEHVEVRRAGRRR